MTQKTTCHCSSCNHRDVSHAAPNQRTQISTYLVAFSTRTYLDFPCMSPPTNCEPGFYPEVGDTVCGWFNTGPYFSRHPSVGLLPVPINFVTTGRKCLLGCRISSWPRIANLPTTDEGPTYTTDFHLGLWNSIEREVYLNLHIPHDV